METTKKLHIGDMLRQYIEKNKVNRSETGRKMGLTSTILYSYESRPSLQIASLMRVCHSLEHNFFMDIANTLPENYSVDSSLQPSKDQIIAQMAEEIKKLKYENELMRDLMGKRS